MTQKVKLLDLLEFNYKRQGEYNSKTEFYIIVGIEKSYLSTNICILLDIKNFQVIRILESSLESYGDKYSYLKVYR